MLKSLTMVIARRILCLTILLAFVLADASPVTPNGPELELTGIEVDSIYLYSTDPETLYYGELLQEAKDFVIRGRVRERGTGIRRVTFSPAFGTAPLPMIDFPNGEWSVRYSIHSDYAPAVLTITAEDRESNTVRKQVRVIKDTMPPDPPTWVKASKQADSELTPDKEKMSNSRQIAVTWTDGQDNESGLRYHVMGNKPSWRQNVAHKNGDIEEASEGENIFYVFAVDNVGNVSVAGTDRIFVDSIPPAAPLLNEAVASGDYFYGTCDPDVEMILVNGRPDEALEVTSPGNWRYKHGLSDGQRITLRLEALDRVKNKSPAAEFILETDRTPPQIFYAEHNAAERTLRVKDSLTITAKGEEKSKVFFRIAGVTENIPMSSDARQRGIYTGEYTFTSDQPRGQLDVIVTFYDRAGNFSEQKTLQPLLVDSWAELAVDNFEARGDLYPWKNYLKARNISVQENADFVQAPEGSGILRVDYDLAGKQAWAGLTSREFLPRNYYGVRPALQFWLKGSGSAQARLLIQLLPKNTRNQGLNTYNNDFTYSIPLNDTEWKKYSVLIPENQLTGLEQTARYAVYVYSTDKQDRGTFYLDDLKVIYHRPLNIPVKAESIIEIPPTVKIPPVDPETPVVSDGGALLAPYLNLELSPSVLTRGQAQTVKVSIPPELVVGQAYVVWGRINQKLQTTKLESVGNNVFKGEYLVPIDLQSGEQQGVVFVQTKSGQLYKKPFYYKVLTTADRDQTEQITAQFFPQPLVAGRDIRVRVNIPLAVKSQQVMIFLNSEQNGVFSAALRKEKNLSDSQEVWQGVFVLPENTPVGEYTANIFCKTADGSFIKKRVRYSVQ